MNVIFPAPPKSRTVTTSKSHSNDVHLKPVEVGDSMGNETQLISINTNSFNGRHKENKNQKIFFNKNFEQIKKGSALKREN